MCMRSLHFPGQQTLSNETHDFSFLLILCWIDWVVRDIALRFQWLRPPPPSTFNLNTPPHPTGLPSAASLLPPAPDAARADYALLSLPLDCGASLGTVFTSVVAFGASLSPLALSSFTVLPLWDARAQERPVGRGGGVGDTKTEEIVLKANHGVSLTAKLSALSHLLCHFSKKAGKEMGGGG